jgi:catechol 2,3-dioxygenase-like lactoylglutathione lyase family enzyme
MTIQRMDHVGVVVSDLEAAIDFCVALGMSGAVRTPHSYAVP